MREREKKRERERERAPVCGWEYVYMCELECVFVPEINVHSNNMVSVGYPRLLIRSERVCVKCDSFPGSDMNTTPHDATSGPITSSRLTSSVR